MRKPGAFARYRFREQMFPTMTFRLAYDTLRERRGERADVEYVRILHLAATTMESTVDSALALLLEAGAPFNYGAVSRAFAKRTTAAEESCTTGVMIEGRMAGGVGTVWERERTVQG